MMVKPCRILHLALLLFASCLVTPALPAIAHAATLSFTLTTSEPVMVTGAPRIAIDVGGTMRHATYASGSGTTSLTFSHAVQPGDFDANGITLVSPLDLNGGSIADAAGNPMGPLSFTLPDTSALKVQTYTAAFTTNPITNTNANAVSFAIAKAPVGASFAYTITSSGGAGSVAGSGTISAATHAASDADVSALPAGTLSLSVTVSTPEAGTGTAVSAAATPIFTGVLDGLPGAVAAFSVRRLRSGHAGPLLRVRRSSDNAQENIPATVAGNLDGAALASFCGAASCFVSAIYDQSGNGHDGVQATGVSQPRLFNAGNMEMDGGRPALRYTGAGQVLVAPVLPGQTVQATLNTVARVTDTLVNRHVLGDRGGPGGRLIRAEAGGASFRFANVNAGNLSVPGATTQQRVATMLSGPTTALVGVLDGIVTATGTTFFFASGAPLWIGGGGPGQSATGDWIGTISEATVFNGTLTTAQRQALEQDQGSYYGIAVQ